MGGLGGDSYDLRDISPLCNPITFCLDFVPHFWIYLCLEKIQTCLAPPSWTCFCTHLESDGMVLSFNLLRELPLLVA